ncbi:hypothetical protein DIC66_19390 [Rhodoferax lacus]|uniref:Uncharacterized protein n=1 Tax=Rhodoferax lacus TaxID=2184758 RepID=A0A3E1R7C7_9BURK|nr:hypothetical protein DIC66_19390 [Rhodoferax lacus]
MFLLGMTATPRPQRPDLMDLPNNSRPGGRYRGENDRQLMLEALLSGLQMFYVSGPQ